MGGEGVVLFVVVPESLLGLRTEAQWKGPLAEVGKFKGMIAANAMGKNRVLVKTISKR